MIIAYPSLKYWSEEVKVLCVGMQSEPFSCRSTSHKLFILDICLNNVSHYTIEFVKLSLQNINVIFFLLLAILQPVIRY